MSKQDYAFQTFDKELMARANGRDMAISTKVAIEICNYLRKRKLVQAKMLLQGVVEKKQAIPYKRFTDGVGHRSGKLASGRYPIKASRAILKLLESAEANAQTKGLNTADLEIVHMCANKAHSPVHYGRHSGREFKRTHVEVVLQETTKKEDSKAEKKIPEVPAKKTEATAEVKIETKTESPAPKSVQKKEEPKEEPKEQELPKADAENQPKADAENQPKAEVPENPEDKK